MPKVAKSKNYKVNSAISKYSGEFEKNSFGDLYCIKCTTIVNCDKEFNIEAHRKTEKHQKNLKSCTGLYQSKLAIVKNEFSFKLVKAFTSANIALSKLRNKSIVSFFKDLGYDLPSESSCREKVAQISKAETDKMLKSFKDESIFLIADETQINNTKFVHVLIGNIKFPQQIFLIEHKAVNECNTATMTQIIDDVVREVGVPRKNFVLLISDAAPYMMSTGRSLKVLYPTLIHITCFAHLLHNCASMARASFSAVDDFIATMRMALLKNKTRQALFKEIGLPPDVVLTRWGSWLKAVSYYSKNFIEVKAVVETFEGKKVVERAKNAVKNPGLFAQLVDLANYIPIIESIDKCESTFFTVNDGLREIKEIKFGTDPANLKAYFTKRIENSIWNNLAQLNFEEVQVAPDVLSAIMGCPGTSISVERSFSMLKKLLEKERNFKLDNIKSYMVLYFNENKSSFA